MLTREDIVEEIGGAYKFYCYVLADFNPILARELEAECSIEEIAMAISAKAAYNKVEKE